MNNILPYGAALKEYIAHSNISSNDLKDFLNSKGIFLNSYERKEMISIFETLLILPEEFRLLADKVKEKNERVKHLSQKYRITKDFCLIDELSDFQFDYDNDSMNENYEYLSVPSLVEDSGSCIFEYKIKTYDKYQSWGQITSEHEGAVSFELNGDQLIVEATAEYTTPETRKINESIINCVKQHLIKKEFFDANVKAEYIKYDDFCNNNERVDFLLSFKDAQVEGAKFEEITEVKFAPDKRENISSTDLAWMEDHVTKSILSGKEIEKISFFMNDKNYNAMIIESVTLKFSLDIENITGNVFIKVGFPEIINFTLPDKAFEFSVIDIRFDNDKNKKQELYLNKKISKNLHNQRERLFDLIIKKRT